MPSKKKPEKAASKKKPRKPEKKPNDPVLPTWWPAPVAERVRELIEGDPTTLDSCEHRARMIVLLTDPRMESVFIDIGKEFCKIYAEFATGDKLDQWVAEGLYNILEHASNINSGLAWRQTVPSPSKWKEVVGKIQHHTAELRKLLDDHVTGAYRSDEGPQKALLAPPKFSPWDVFDPVARDLRSRSDPEYMSLLDRYMRTRFGPHRKSTYASILSSSPDARTTLNTLDVELELIAKLAAHAALPRSWHMRQSDNFSTRVYVQERYRHFKSMGLSPRTNSADTRDGFRLYSIIATIANVALALTDDALTGEDVRKMIPTSEQ